MSAQAVPAPASAPASAPHAGPDDAARAALEQLHPLLQPPPPPWTPQTPGWAVLALALALLLAWAAWRGLRRWHARRHRRLARAELRQLRSELAAPADASRRAAAARRLPELVRRLALAHAARDEVASLQGAAWSAWLDRSLPEDAQPFTRGPGRRLADWAYLPEAALPWDELDPLLDLVERWIGRHHVPLAPQ
ncbi:MAG: DUF4381 domain-containing protein [Rubrivivax sp.]|nr:DUF4381 domain-containing protein [Rubrivivax sp.]